ncbi:hypothetical protein GXW82_17845 [Streptacidiphilus sp. 4-A2]|nr:hypothetical protein [Streptacidiphilus sp. 4-A2]
MTDQGQDAAFDPSKPVLIHQLTYLDEGDEVTVGRRRTTPMWCCLPTAPRCCAASPRASRPSPPPSGTSPPTARRWTWPTSWPPSPTWGSSAKPTSNRWPRTPRRCAGPGSDGPSTRCRACS